MINPRTAAPGLGAEKMGMANGYRDDRTVRTPVPLQGWDTRVVSVEADARYLLLTLEHPDLGKTFAPGQFVQVVTRSEGVWDPFLLRPFSVMDEEVGLLRLLILKRGRGSRWLFHRRPGDRVRVLGPLGRPFPVVSRADLVGGGSGIAPLYFYARRFPDRVVRLRVGFRTRPPSFLREAFRRLSVSVEVTTEDGSAGTTGTVLTGWAPKAPCVLTCGPLPMMRGVVAASPGREVWVSVEEVMGCGMGLCMGCAAPRREGGYWRTCTDGPVFPAHALRLDEG